MTSRPIAFSLSAILISLALNGCGQVDLATTRKFQRAEEIFREADSREDYLRAAAVYQDILDSGVISGVVLYNQGNAYAKAGEHGRAIAAYRRAQRYRPEDPYLDANLKFVLAEVGQSPQSSSRPLPETILFWQNWVGYEEKFLLVTLAGGATLLLALIAQWSAGRHLWRRLALTGLAATSLFAVSAGYDWYRFDYRVQGAVTAEEVIARKGNSPNYDPAFNEPLTEGTEFELIERRRDWLLVRIPGVGEGWLPESAAVTF